MNFFTSIFEGFQVDFKLLFIVLFLGIISSRFSGGRRIIFQMGGFIIKWGVGVHHGGGIGFDEGVFEKKCWMEGAPHFGKSWEECEKI